ncbi:type III effector [Pseudomonas syringae pv. pisi]|uniref:NAD(+)--protein-arginine ADP-ribosyltransferase n=8 Tax=Pseudomonas TaxID=286 RepID=Q88BP8_PSESM|nr:ADP-ribosyltransferase domain-containing protein [Pseudomonas syringae]AAO59043.1 type III effector HopO1-1 [Pseudomonas syringae pv. tomato str. DC3000]MBW8025017.1 type III effector [Pseudomonas syringae pv. tomato]PYD08000.1 type III effector [Pseudomonas syringae pv. pisi]RMU75755.1 Type III effector HopO1-1 [Pseudomonas syringae pv. aptata]POP94686.1 type III effector [Pseudomonas syringae pv. avii]
MGNICGTSGSNHVYSPPISPQHASGSSTPVPSASGTMLSLSHEQILSQNYASNIKGKYRTNPRKGPSPRLSDTLMKQALSSVITQEKKRLKSQPKSIAQDIQPPNSMIKNALDEKDSHPFGDCFSDDEFLAIHLYTSCLYRPINHHLRYAPKNDVAPVVEAMNSGLAKLAQYPDYQVSGQLHRGIKQKMDDGEVMSRFKPGNTYRDDAFMSTSTRMDVTEEFTSDVTLHLQSSSAVNIGPFSKNPYEDEALIPPLTPFKVTGLHKQDDRWHVHLNEIAESSDE